MDDDENANVETKTTVTVKEEFAVEDSMEREYPGWRVPLSVVVGVGWLMFLIIWLFFYAGDHHIYQNLGMLLLSLTVVAIILGLAWMTWAFGNVTEFEKMMMQIGGMKTRMIVSMLVPLICLVLLGLWLYFMAVDFNIYQNIAVVIVIILIMGGILGIIWTTGGWKRSGAGF